MSLIVPVRLDWQPSTLAVHLWPPAAAFKILCKKTPGLATDTFTKPGSGRAGRLTTTATFVLSTPCVTS